jgi:ribonuclease HI
MGEMNDSPSAAQSKALPFVRLFTDGACSGNPGPGGWAFILKHPASGAVREFAGAREETTNNQMELQALISGLQALKSKSDVEVVTDSTYVAKGCSEWMAGWKRNGWRRKDGSQWKPVKNAELWQQLDELLARHNVRFTVVNGHSGHPENERCDELAVEAIQQLRASKQSN